MSRTSARIDGASVTGVHGASASAVVPKNRDIWKPMRLHLGVVARRGVGLVEREVRRRAEADDAVDRLQAGRGDEREVRAGGLAVDAHRAAAAVAAELLADRVEDVAEAGGALLVVDRDDAPAARGEDVAGVLEEDPLGVGVVAGPAAGVDHDDGALDVAVGGVARHRVGDGRDDGRRRRRRAEQPRRATAAPAPRRPAGRAVRGAPRGAPRSVRVVPAYWTYRPLVDESLSAGVRGGPAPAGRLAGRPPPALYGPATNTSRCSVPGPRPRRAR